MVRQERRDRNRSSVPGAGRHHDRHHVVVIGAGFGGMNLARQLRGTEVDVTIIDANNFHTFQPLLYQVATAGLSADDVAHNIRAVFSHRGSENVDVLMAEVVDIDTDLRRLATADGGGIDYDTLVVAAGAVSNDFGVPGVAEYAFPLKSVADATALNRSVLAMFERAARAEGPLPRGALDIVISGGGPTGVEMAGGLSELYTKVLASDFPGLPVDDARIVVVDMADRLLTPFSEQSSARARRTLEAMGVDVRLGVGVERIGADTVYLADGTELVAGLCIWAAGVKANPLASALGVPLASGGRIPVGHDLAVDGLDDVYAIGDIAATPDTGQQDGQRDGRPLPQLAQPAIQGGRHVARQILRRLHGEPTETFSYTDKGTMATIGRHSAVAELPGGIRFGGWIGWISWLLLHLVYLIGFRNRIVVFVNWCWNYLTFDRASRLLSGEQAADISPRGSPRASPGDRHATS